MHASPRFFGWRVVWGAFALAILGWGIGFYGPPIYLDAVVRRTGWSVTLVASAVTGHFLIGAIVVANLPALYRRVGVPVVTQGGAGLLATGVVGWAVAAEPWQLFAAAILSGTGWATMGAAAINAIVAPWFVRLRPAALATAYNGASIGGVVFSPLWVTAIAGLGFAPAAVIVGIAMALAVSLLATRLFSVMPRDLGQEPDGGAGQTLPPATQTSRTRLPPGTQLWRDRAFVTLAAGMALGLFAQIGLLAHLFAVLVPVLTAHGAGVAMGVTTACAIVGRTLVGWLMPPGADRRRVAAGSHTVQTAGSVLLIVSAGESVPLLLAGLILFGAGIGNATSLPPMIAQVDFASGDVPRVVSLIVGVSQGLYAFAPATFGMLRALGAATPALPAGETTALFGAAAVIQVLAIVCFLGGPRRQSIAARRAR